MCEEEQLWYFRWLQISDCLGWQFGHILFRTEILGLDKVYDCSCFIDNFPALAKGAIYLLRERTRPIRSHKLRKERGSEKEVMKEYCYHSCWISLRIRQVKPASSLYANVDQDVVRISSTVSERIKLKGTWRNLTTHLPLDN